MCVQAPRSKCTVSILLGDCQLELFRGFVDTKLSRLNRQYKTLATKKIVMAWHNLKTTTPKIKSDNKCPFPKQPT